MLFFAGTLVATSLVETTFNIPGLGLTGVQAALDRDIPVLQVIGTIRVPINPLAICRLDAVRSFW